MKTSADRRSGESVGAVFGDHGARRHLLWFVLWLTGLVALWGWTSLFLNGPALRDLEQALLNSLTGGLLVALFALAAGWGSAMILVYLENRDLHVAAFAANFFLNLVRSAPQIVGILLGYIVVTRLMLGGWFGNAFQQIIVTAAVISAVVFPDVTALIQDRIAYFRRREFYDAMLCCGISHWRIINWEILRKNSLAHLVHKAVAVFGMAVFLQCSIDFIISVGLSNEVSSTNFPVTLGSMLARMDSKQDVLAISTLFTQPSYLPELMTRHLQGISVAWTIVFTLLCMYNIANGLVRRYRL